MSKNVSIFIEKLENGFPTMDNGYIVYDDGFWRGLIWYRYDIEADIWQWTDNLIKWHSVTEQIINISKDNMEIINYLRLKSLNKNIKVLSKKMDRYNEIEELIHRLFINYKTLDKPFVDEKYKKDHTILHYLTELQYEYTDHDIKLSNLMNIENTFIIESEKIQTRNSSKDYISNYTNSMIIEKLLILESRFKISYIMNGLKMRMVELDYPADISNSYKIKQLDTDINEICNFSNNKNYIIHNIQIYNSMLNFQTNLLYSLGLPTDKNLQINNEKILESIDDLKIKNGNEIEKLDMVNNELNTTIKKMENEKLILIKNVDDIINRLKKLELKYAILEASKKDLEYENSELECSICVNNEDILKLKNQNASLNKINDNLLLENDKLKKHIENVQKLCPNIIFNDIENIYVLKEDTYDMLDDTL